MTTATLDRVVSPVADERDALAGLRDQINAIVDLGGSAALVGPSGERVPIPGSVFEALRVVVDGMARGQTMTLMPHGARLTTGQAAEILNISRQHLVRLIDAGKVPCERTETHRRLRIEDVLKFRARRMQERRDAMTKLIVETEAAGGYAAE